MGLYASDEAQCHRDYERDIKRNRETKRLTRELLDATINYSRGMGFRGMDITMNLSQLIGMLTLEEIKCQTDIDKLIKQQEREAALKGA